MSDALSVVVAGLRAHRFRFRHEAQLQKGIDIVLSGLGVPYDREVFLTVEDCIDFFIEPGLGLEVKIQGRTEDVLRQLGRYAMSDRVKTLLLVTSRLRLASAVPSTLGGKRVVSIHLSESTFG